MQMIPTEHPEKKQKRIIKANINAEDRRENEHNVCSLWSAAVLQKHRK